MDQFAGYLLLAICVIIHVAVLLRVIAGLRARHRALDHQELIPW